LCPINNRQKTIMSLSNDMGPLPIPFIRPRKNFLIWIKLLTYQNSAWRKVTTLHTFLFQNCNGTKTTVQVPYFYPVSISTVTLSKPETTHRKTFFFTCWASPHATSCLWYADIRPKLPTTMRSQIVVTGQLNNNDTGGNSNLQFQALKHSIIVWDCDSLI
jgi:hypothetical protein